MDKHKVLTDWFKIMPSFILKAQNRILFESTPDLSDNTKPVFDEIVKRNLNSKYELIWLVSNRCKNYPMLKNVKYVTYNEKLKWRYYQLTSKLIICCNNILQAYKKDQKSIYLTHGLPIKAVKNYYTVPENVNYTISPSVNSRKIISDQFNVDLHKVKALGYPRNDVLTTSQIDINKLFRFDGKIIIWLPTFRQQHSGRKHGGNALPIIHDEQIAYSLNQVAKDNNVMLVLKPHFAQDMSYIKKHNLSNIKIISDSFLQKSNITLYQLLSSSSALLSDYSSVYFDYTICDKPIGVIWEDIEDYRKEPGFAVDLNYYLKGAEKIFTYNDFSSFIKAVANGFDKLKEERNEIKEEVTFSDGKSAKRIVDFIENILTNM